MVEHVTVPDAVAPPPKHPRFPMIDGARAVAVLSIVVFHAAVLGNAVSSSVAGRVMAHLNIGVAIFFVISGFLLYRPFIAHRAGGPGPPSLPDYAKRRVLRIYPAYWLALTVLAVLPGIAGVLDGNLLAMYALVHSQCVSSFGCRLSQTWSLVVEVSFYVVLPFYALAVGRLTRGRALRSWVRAELILLAALSGASLALQFGLFPRNTPTWIAATLVGHFLWFAFGMALAVLSAARAGGMPDPWFRRAVVGRPGVVWLLALAGYAGLCAWLPSTPFVVGRGQVFVETIAFGAIGALFILPAAFAPLPSAPGRILTQPVVAWIGLISYGIFLWHFAVALDLGFLGHKASFGVVLIGTLGITIPIAAVSYYVLERPLLRLKYRSIRRVIPRMRPSPERAKQLAHEIPLASHRDHGVDRSEQEELQRRLAQVPPAAPLREPDG
jgi:peptidoglycan/LPS O-acetylase OafA/YrhL